MGARLANLAPWKRDFALQTWSSKPPPPRPVDRRVLGLREATKGEPDGTDVLHQLSHMMRKLQDVMAEMRPVAGTAKAATPCTLCKSELLRGPPCVCGACFMCTRIDPQVHGAHAIVGARCHNELLALIAAERAVAAPAAAAPVDDASEEVADEPDPA